MDSQNEQKIIESRSYWLKKLLGSADTTGIKQDFYRMHNHVRSDKFSEIDINKALCEKLNKLANGKDFLLYVALMAALNICLYKYNASDSIIVGSPCLKEGNIEAERNAVVIVNKIDRSMNFRNFLLNVRKNLLLDYEHQEYPISSLISELKLNAIQGKCPLFDIVLLLTNIHCELPNVNNVNYVNNDITISFTKNNENISGQIKYDGSIYNDETIKTFISYYLNVLNSTLDDTNIEISKVSIFSHEELEKFEQWNKNSKVYNKEKCVHQLFEEQAQKTPDAIAVVFGDKKLSYAQLDLKSSKLARYIRKLGVTPNSLVGICMEPSIEMVIGLIGILKSGVAYVPVDAKYPKDRINYMLKDANPVVVLTKTSLAELLDDINSNLLFLDVEWNKIDSGDCENIFLDGVTAENLAYIIYTSGSTGKPKGSGVYQRGWMNLLNWFIQEFSISSEDKVLLISSFSFDLTQKNIFAPLIKGGELHIPATEYYDPDFILKSVCSKGITLLNCTPSAFYPLVDLEDFDKLASIRCLFLGGETISLPRLKKWIESKYYSAKIVNTYGPTECTDICAFYTVTQEDYEKLNTIPIGKPIYNTQLYILNSLNEMVPLGMTGELCIAGDGVGIGYINDEALTKEKFINNPFSLNNNELLYKTGDLACYLPDGNINYIGRIDHQVKVRGFRIELGEVETALKQHSSVEEAVVLVKESSSGDKKLEAFIVPDQQSATVVKKLAEFERKGILDKHNVYELQNQMTFFHLNKTETEFIYREIFEEQSYLQNGITLEEGSTVMDVGANIGMFSIFANIVCKKNVQIYAFEPIDPIFEVLEKNIELYCNGNVKVFKCGLADIPRSEDITYYPNVSIMSGRYADSKEDQENVKTTIFHEMSQSGNKTELTEQEIDELVSERLRSELYNCKLTTISEVVKENGIEKIDLLKIDVEKSELDILKGISNEDWGKIKQIVLELHDIDGRLFEVKSLLESKGYVVTYCKDSKLEENEIYNLYAISSDIKEGKKSYSSSQKELRLWHSGSAMINDIREWIKDKLPEYMIPSNITFVDEIPLTPNGKVNREALLEYGEEHQQVKDDFEAPRNELEETIANIWTEVLELKSVGINDNFLQIGGHSLLATAIISRLRKLYKVEVPIFLFFENPTISKLAKVFEDLLEKSNGKVE